MAIYLINVFLILAFGYLFLYHWSGKDNKKIYCGLVAFQWILISGLRNWSVGADTYAYYLQFENVKKMSWSKIFDNIVDYLFNGLDIKDPGYALIEKIFQIFSGDYQVYLVFIALFFTGFMAVWIYRNSSMPEISFLIFSVLFYAFYAVTGHRQTIATALVVFLGYKYIKERKLIKFALLSFGAFLIHKSSLVFAPFYFMANIPITPIYVVIAVIFMIVIVMLGKPLYGAIAESMGFDEQMINYDVGGAETYATILTLVCLVVLFFYIYYKDRVPYPRHIFNITLLTLMSSLLVFQNQSFMRVQQYYSLFLMISLPEVVLSFDKKFRLLVYACAVVVLLLYLIRNNPTYMFFWQ